MLNEVKYEERIKPLLNDPRYEELQKEIIRIEIESSRLSVYDKKNQKKSEQLRNRQQYLKKETKLMKKKYGVEDVYPTYSCPICKDEGFVNGKRCKCFNREVSNQIFMQSGFEKLEDFEKAKKTCGDLAPVYNLMQKWCKSDFKKNLIYIAGPTGVGKTYLIRAMANELINRGLIVKIETAFQIDLDFREFTLNFNVEKINKYLEPEILFIDDLGTEPLFKNITLEYFYLIINERKMRKLPTVITSNLNMSDLLERYEERIFSRIADRETSINIYLDGDDIRLKKRK